MTEEPASVAGPPGLADAAVDQSDERNAASRSDLGVSDRRALGILTWLLRAIRPESAKRLTGIVTNKDAHTNQLD